MSDPMDAEPTPDPSTRRDEAPFPWVLLVLAALMAFASLSSDVWYLRWGSVVAAVILGAAALYQARPSIVPPTGPSDDDAPPAA